MLAERSGMKRLPLWRQSALTVVHGLMADAVDRKQHDVRPAGQAGQQRRTGFRCHRHAAEKWRPAARPPPASARTGSAGRRHTAARRHPGEPPAARRRHRAGGARCLDHVKFMAHRVAVAVPPPRGPPLPLRHGLRRRQPVFHRRPPPRMGGQAAFQISHKFAQRGASSPPPVRTAIGDDLLRQSLPQVLDSAVAGDDGLMQRLLLAVQLRLQRRLFRLQPQSRRCPHGWPNRRGATACAPRRTLRGSAPGWWPDASVSPNRRRGFRRASPPPATACAQPASVSAFANWLTASLCRWSSTLFNCRAASSRRLARLTATACKS